MPEYCSQSDVINRLSEDGLRYLIDRDQDGLVSEDEKTRFLDVAIERAGLTIDTQIQHLMRPNFARAAANDYLKHICVDLAVGQIARLAGGEPAISVIVSENEAKKKLERIRYRTDVIPGLVYPLPGVPTSQMRPSNGMVINPR